MKIFKKVIYYLVPSLVGLMFVLTLIFSCFMEKSYNTNITSELTTFEENWTVKVYGNTYTAEFPFSLDDENMCVLENTLPDVNDNEILILKYQYQDVTCTVEDEVIYTFSQPHVGKTKTILGTNILSIPMKSEYSGKTIKLQMKGIKATEPVSIEHMYLATPGDFLYSIFKSNLPQFIISLLLVITSFLYIILFVLSKTKKLHSSTIDENYFLGMFVFTFTTGMWVLTDLHLFYIMTGKLVINDILSYFFFMTIPIGFVPVIYFIIKQFKRIFWTMEYIYGLNVVIQTILFLSGAVDLANMLIVSQILMGFGIVGVFILVIAAVRKGMNFENLVLMVGFCIFGLFVLICLLGYLFGNIDFNYNIWFLCGMVILACDFGFILLQSYMRVITENASMSETRKYAFTDGLTQVGNRHAYEECLSEEKRKLSHYHFGIIGFDVNFLKQSNDTLGHKAGDELLKACASLIEKNFGTENNIFRTGGDEFSAIVELNHAELDSRMYQFLKDVENWHGVLNQSISIAYGAALLDDYKDLTLEELSMKADEKMYAKKKEMHAKIEQMKNKETLE